MRHQLLLRLCVVTVFAAAQASLLAACSGKDEAVEEPVETEAPAGEEEAAPPEDAGNDLGSDAMDVEADSDLSEPGDAGPAPVEMAPPPAVEQPAPAAVNPVVGAECKGIAKFSERKRCFERAYKASKGK